MKFKKGCKFVWKIVKCYILPIFLLFVGYRLLSPDYVEGKIRFVIEFPWFPFKSCLKDLIPNLRIFVPTLSLLQNIYNTIDAIIIGSADFFIIIWHRADAFD